MELSEIWSKAALLLKERLNADTFDRWMADIVAVRTEDGDTAVLGVANELFCDWLQENYGSLICEELERVSGVKYTLKFEPGHAPQRAAAPVSAVSAPETAAAVAEPTVSVAATRSGSAAGRVASVYKTPSGFEFSGRFSFDEFVVGDNSRYAYGACQAVSEAPGTAYNPLFIHSPVGLGKSHLLQAIGQEVLNRRPDAVVEYVTTEEFFNQYVYALQHNGLPDFRNRIRRVDVLLVDDIQFLGQKNGFQEEYFHTFNALHNAHKQIVMASDRPPQEINGLEKRLVSRFEWGLTTDIQAPDLETRIAIIRKKQEKQEVKLSDEVITYLATRLKSNVRRLEGALTSLILHAKFQKQAVTTEVAEEVLAGMLNEEEASQLSVEQIQRVVAEHYDIRFADMTSKRRPASIAFPRQVAMYLARELTELSYPDIAEQFAKNHATVLHAVTTIKDKMMSNPEFKREIACIERKLRS